MSKNFFPIIIFILMLFSFSGCDEDNIERTDTFEVISRGYGPDCGLIVIEFKEEDLYRLSNLTNESSWLRYYAFNLNDEFSPPGTSLIVTMRQTKDDELHNCTFKGPSYPWVTALKARLKKQ